MAFWCIYPGQPAQSAQDHLEFVKDNATMSPIRYFKNRVTCIVEENKPQFLYNK